MPRTALSLFGVQAALALGVRAAVHRWQTGSFGLRIPSAGAAPLEWAIGASFVLGALLLGVAAPLLQLGGFVGPIASVDTGAIHRLGVLCFALGLGAELCSQFWMGASWRVGVDQSEQTRLITSGPFVAIRNPIFTFMILVSVGLTLLVPNAVALIGLGLLVLATEVQVRGVEEAYLRRVHGARYLAYAARAGRFFPGVGRLVA